MFISVSLMHSSTQKSVPQDNSSDIDLIAMPKQNADLKSHLNLQ